MYGSKKYLLKDHLTILLLVVFVLIKANPCYYIFQYPASSAITHSRQSTSVGDAHRTDQFLIKLDKSITENVDSKHVPEIKFTGIPFALFFLFLPVVFCRRSTRPFNYTLSPSEACIGKCILRL